MITPAMLGTADDGKRLVLYPLEITHYFMAAAIRECIVVAAEQTKDGAKLSEVFASAALYAAAVADAMLEIKSERAR